MHKTGTTSFHHFMSGLGFRSLHDVSLSMALLGLGQSNDGEEGDGRQAPLASMIGPVGLHDLVSRFDCFSDNPWPVLYKLLDATFPGSRFVLTARPTAEWLDSQMRFFGGANARMRQWIYGYGNPLRHAERYREIYEQHNAAVRAHFAGRSDFIEIAIGGDNREIGAQLWEFLGLRGTPTAFPLSNKGR